MITLREVEGVKERIRKEIINERVKKEIKNVDGYIKNKINEEMAKLKEKKEKEIKDKIKEIMKRNEDAYINLSMLDDKINVITEYIKNIQLV